MSSKHVAASAALVVSALGLATVWAQQPDAPSSFTTHACAMVLGSEVCTWVSMEGEAAVELAATIPMALVKAVPADAEMVWPPEQLAAVPLPEEARTALGIDHMGINWEAHGHPPATFLAPHFDFHFYNLAEADIRAIDCADTSKPERLPAGYALPDIDVPGLGMLAGLCVPRMGMHAMPQRETKETEAFEASMMLGYYGGEPIFFEPMVAQDLLLGRSDFTLPMPAVEGLPAGVRYPGAFRAEYDAGEEHYRLVFTDFYGS